VRAAPGTAMDVGGIPDPEDRANVIAFLSTLQAETGVVGGDPELLARIGAADPAEGELLVTTRCAGCHRLTEDGAQLIGPNLFGIVGAPVGGAAGFNYSPAIAELNDDGAIWTGTRLDAFIENPAVAIPGTRMGFGGVADEDERAAIIAYLRTNAETVLPLAGEDPDILLSLGVYQPELNRLAFSAGQSRAGDRYYFEAACDACHGPSMRGTEPAPGQDGAPALIGEEFAANWFSRNVFELYEFIYFHGATDFQDAITTYLTAYILERNGFQPGRTDMPRNREGMQAMGFYQ
jgi:cytochrome c